VGAGQSAKEVVDRRAFLPPRFQLGQSQMSVNGVKVGVGRNDVNMIPFNECGTANLLDWESGVRLQQFRQVALMIGREVYHDHECQIAIGWYVFQKYLKRRQSAGRGSDSNHGRLRL
jgi:hypothetical protein